VKPACNPQFTGPEARERRPRWVKEFLLSMAVFAIAVAPGGMAARIQPQAHAASTDQNKENEPTAAVATDQPDFDFRSSFWVNLHHFVYLQAVLAKPGGRKGSAELSARDAAGVPTMSASQKAAWDKAVSYYARFTKSDLLEQDDFILANYEFSNAGNSASCPGTQLPAQMRAVLEAAAPVYRALWWKEQDRRNREWIASAGKLVHDYEGIGPRIASLYATEWPRRKTPVEVVFYADFGGAYTTTQPTTLITISSVDPGNQGYATPETLFHEASHALIDTLQRQLASRLSAAGKTPTYQLIHVIIFYTAGEVTAEALARNGIRDYVPYAIKYGLYTRVPGWAHYRELCEQDWQPYIDGKIGFDETLSRMSRDF
jgi:hypothetical protein